MEIPTQHTPGSPEQRNSNEDFDFDTFYKIMGPRAIARARSLGARDPEGAWHDVALSVHREGQNGTLKSAHSLTYVSLRNTVVSEFRHFGAHEEPTDELPETPYDDEADSRAAYSALLNAIAANPTISADQLEAFKLVHMKGLTVAEAAELVGDAPGTIKSRLYAACRTLKADPTIAGIAKENGYDKATKRPGRKKGK